MKFAFAASWKCVCCRDHLSSCIQNPNFDYYPDFSSCLLVLASCQLLVGQVPSWPGIAHYKFVATIGGGVLVAKVQHSLIAKVGPSMSTQFSPNQATQICPHRKIGIFPSGYHQLVIRARLIGERLPILRCFIFL